MLYQLAKLSFAAREVPRGRGELVRRGDLVQACHNNDLVARDKIAAPFNLADDVGGLDILVSGVERAVYIASDGHGAVASGLDPGSGREDGLLLLGNEHSPDCNG